MLYSVFVLSEKRFILKRINLLLSHVKKLFIIDITLDDDVTIIHKKFKTVQIKLNQSKV